MLRFSGGQSARTSAGLKLDGDLSSRAWRVNLSATAKLSDELAGANTATIEGADVSITDRLGGVSSDFGARLDVAGARDGAVTGFVAGAYRVRRGFDTATLSGGVSLRW